MKCVSIIMPAYNAEEFIGEAISSIIHQTEKNWELLILNDASTDATLDIVHAFKDARISVVENPANQGYLYSCNQLMNMAQGEFITFLDADDTCPPTRLENCIKHLQNQNADFLTTDHSRFGVHMKKAKSFESSIDYLRMATDPDYYPTVCCATIFARLDLVRKCGGYHPIFNRMGAEDYHWLFRLSRIGKGVHLNMDLYSYRQHKGQIRQRSEAGNFIAHDLDKAIRSTLIQRNIDLLKPENEKQLNQLKDSLLMPFSKDKTLIERHRAVQLLNSGQPKQALSTMLNALIHEPFKSANWRTILYLTYVSIRRQTAISIFAGQ